MKRFIFILSYCVVQVCTHAQIGPAFSFSCYVGGNGYEQVRDVAADRHGNIYITGGTSSPDFPTTPGSYSLQVNSSGRKIMDAFITKLDSNGKTVWSTLVGGPEYDRAYAIEVDDNGFVYIAGRAGRGLPTTSSSFQPSFGGDNDINKLYGEQDGFIAKISPDGSKLIWCSYFGAGDRGFIRDMALDDNGDVYVVATETSAECKYVHADAAQPRRGGSYDAIVARISADGKEVIWASYLGGSNNDLMGPSIHINSVKQIVVAGTTDSRDMAITETAYDRTYNGEQDVFVAIFSNDGTKLVLGTYLGGSGIDGTETHNLVLDKDDQIIVAATTSSLNFPVAGNAYQKKYGGSGGAGTGLYTNYPFDGFIAKLSADGRHLLASTYFGGDAGDAIEGVGVDAKGNIYCSGASFSNMHSKNDNSFQKSNRGNGDQFLGWFSSDLSDLYYFSFIGGEEKDYGRTLHTDVLGNIYIAGESSSPEFPASNKFYGGGQDGTLTKFSGAEK